MAQSNDLFPYVWVSTRDRRTAKSEAFQAAGTMTSLLLSQFEFDHDLDLNLLSSRETWLWS
jgi:hypothetical protein